MSEPYTPTTREVRAAFGAIFIESRREQAYAEFDRWLAEHDRQVAERAWGEGAKAQADAYGMEVDTGPNPYRAAKGEQK